MKMQAAVLYQQGLQRPYAASMPLVIEEVTLDSPGTGEVLIEVAAAGLCHSDLSAIEGLRPRRLPSVPGHEGAGIVRALGPGVEGLREGDHVVSTVVSSCGECRWCRRGRASLCPSVSRARGEGTLPSGARRLRVNGQPIHHWSGLSVFAQFAVVDRSALVRIDPDIPLEVAAIVSCAVMTGAGAIFNTAQVRPGDTVAVVGLGGVGMSAIMAAATAGAERIVAIDLNPAKFEAARALGATDVASAMEEDCAVRVRDATDGGLDFVIETAGSMAAMELAYSVSARGGTTVSVGLPHPEKRFCYPQALLVSEERCIRGSYMGSALPQRDIPLLLGLYRHGKLPIDRLISGHLALDQINHGFDQLADGAVLRQILRPHA